jgi:acetolactate synthase I/II/III large subunit
MKSERLADYLVSRFVDFGVKDAFIVTGGGAMHLNDAIARSSKLNKTFFHHEQAAAMAADGYFRLSNKSALVNVTTGPGGVNALNGVFGAYTDSLNVIVLSGQVKKETLMKTHPDLLRQLGDQEVDIKSMVHKITKYSTVLESKEDARIVADKAIYFLRNGKPGPVWIDIPIDIQGSLINPAELNAFDIKKYNFSDDNNIPANTKLDFTSKDNLKDKDFLGILELLKKAKNPVLFAGSGIRISDTYSEFIKLTKVLSIPVVTGWNAHDLISNSSAFYAGRPGTVGDRPGNFTVQNSDLIIILGCRLNIRQISYNWRSFAKNAYKVMVDIDIAELNKPTLKIDKKICQNLKTFIPNLLDFLISKNYKPTMEHIKYLDWCRARVKKYPVLQQCFYKKKILNPYVFLKELFDIIDESSVVITANGSACVMTFQVVDIKKQRLFTNSGSASMGYDLPASIGACLANNKKTTICIAGDGSIMMNLQELQTISGNKLPIKIFILNNNGYASILQTQKNFFSDNLNGTDPSNGVTFPNFIDLAKGFNIPAMRLKSVNDLKQKSFIDSLSDKSPQIYDVHVDPDQVFSPKLSSRKLADGSMISPELEDMAPFLSKKEMKDNYFDNES